MPQPGLFDLDERFAAPEGIGDRLGIMRLVAEWEGFRRYLFSRFLDLTPEDVVLDAKTLWRYRESLKSAAVFDQLFAERARQIAAEGYVARMDQIVDAILVAASVQRNRRTESARNGVSDRAGGGSGTANRPVNSTAMRALGGSLTQGDSALSRQREPRTEIRSECEEVPSSGF